MKPSYQKCMSDTVVRKLNSTVVASAVGGIPEVVVDGVTGVLVPLDPGDDAFGSPRDPDEFARDFAAAVNGLLSDADRRAAMGAAGRARVIDHFSWAAIARQTADLYRALTSK